MNAFNIQSYIAFPRFGRTEKLTLAAKQKTMF
jgi:hypothetical protein